MKSGGICDQLWFPSVSRKLHITLNLQCQIYVYKSLFNLWYKIFVLITMQSHGSSVSIETRLWADDQGSVPSMGNDGIFPLCHNVHTISGAHPASYPMSTSGKSGWGMKLTAPLHLVLRLRMQGAIPPFPQYIFIAQYLIRKAMHLHGIVLN
jgi:hypothetical protein